MNRGIENMTIREQDISTFRLSVVGYVIVCVASSGFNQGRFWGGEAPAWLWISLALIGGIVVLIKDINHYHRSKKLLLQWDLIFLIPVLTIPIVPIRHDFNLTFLIIYEMLFFILYIFSYYKGSN